MVYFLSVVEGVSVMMTIEYCFILLVFTCALCIVFVLGISVWVLPRFMSESSEFAEEEESDDDSQVSVPRGTLEKSEDPQQLEKPTKEQLAALKLLFGIEKGSLQFKDGSIYLVTSNKDSKKHEWRRLGRWEDLADSLTKTAAVMKSSYVLSS